MAEWPQSHVSSGIDSHAFPAGQSLLRRPSAAVTLSSTCALLGERAISFHSRIHAGWPPLAVPSHAKNRTDQSEAEAAGERWKLHAAPHTPTLATIETDTITWARAQNSVLAPHHRPWQRHHGGQSDSSDYISIASPRSSRRPDCLPSPHDLRISLPVRGRSPAKALARESLSEEEG